MIQKPVNTPITFTPSDQTVINNVWKVNGFVESTNLIFVKTFISSGVYTVSHECTAACGTVCTPYSEDIEILAESVITGASNDYLWWLLGIIVVAGIIIVDTDNKRNTKTKINKKG